jgi:tetratricopeptide (TPR) repeat protein
MGEYDQAAIFFEEMVRLFPHDEVLQINYSQFVKRIEEMLPTTEFMNILMKANNMNPSNTKTLWKIAETFEILGNVKAAFEKYETIISLKSDHEAAIWKCAYLAMDLEPDYRFKAIDYLKSFIEKHKENDVRAAMARNDLAKLLVEKGQEYYEEAERYWLESINVFPEFHWAYIELGIFYYETNRTKEAINRILEGKRRAIQHNKSEAAEKADFVLKTIKENLGDEYFIRILMESLSQP